jgi:uncharacterized protein YneF (UPF0154 family)
MNCVILLVASIIVSYLVGIFATRKLLEDYIKPKPKPTAPRRTTNPPRNRR